MQRLVQREGHLNFCPSIFLPTGFLGVGHEIALNELSATAGTAWPASNRAIYYPISVPNPVVIQDIRLLTSASASGNADVGIYNRSGTKLVSSGSTAISVAGTWQTFNITDTLLPRGLYYLAMAVDNTTVTFSVMAPAVGLLSAWGVLQEAAAFPLPAAMTGVAPTSAYLQLFLLARTSYAKATP